MPLVEKVGKWLEANEESDTLPGQDRNDHEQGIDNDEEDNNVDDAADVDADADKEKIESVPNLHEYRQVVTQSEAYRWLKSDLRRELLFSYPSQGNAGDTISREIFRPLTLDDNTFLVASLHQSNFELEASGHPDTIVEIGEQLAWISSSMRSSDVPGSVSHCMPLIERVIVKEQTDTSVSMAIRFARPELEIAAEGGSGADCWRQLFRNPTIVEGFPIMRRIGSGTGMELSITTMAALIRAKRINVFKDNFHIKGFCSMLVAVKRLGDTMLWHALVNEDGSDIKYHDSRVQEIRPQTAENSALLLSQLTSMRHVIGWWSHVKNYAGAVDANFDIGRCGLPSPGLGFALEKINVGFSRYITANALVALGKRDKPLPAVTSNVYLDQMRCISRKYAVLYDVDEQRAWLLDGASVLLHLLRSSLIIDEEDGMSPIHGHRDLYHPVIADGSIKPFQVLRESMNLKLYEMPEAEDITIKTKWSGKARPAQALSSRQVTETRKQTWYCIKDRVDLIYSALDEIFDHHSDMSSSGVGFKVRLSPRTQLEGFEFWDIASGASHIRPYTTTLDASGEGWVDLVRELQAIVLFGRGFGEILQPMGSVANISSTSSSGPQETRSICIH
ncbi:hypothetical protein Daus18300_014381 [Diaporthe australafricana]|uniref:Uncharacterized protein n=1 Tax=Diaporthe australafricana TaxID=127596 RepID=A0ABR3VVF7_9PEZI